MINEKDDLVDAARYMSYAFSTPFIECKTMKLTELNVRDMLMIEIGGYNYEIDKNKPNSGDIASVFEAAVDMLEKIKTEVDRLYSVANTANVAVPAAALVKYNEKEIELKNLINTLNSLDA